MRRRRKRSKNWPRPTLTEDQILAWADAHHELKCRWPRKDSGLVPGSWDQRWSGIDTALQKGLRGLQGGSALPACLPPGGECGTRRDYLISPSRKSSGGLMRTT